MRIRPVLAALFLAIGIGACAEETLGPDESAARLGLPGPARLVECPTQESTATTGLINNLGGVLRLGGHTLDVPGGALTEPTVFRLEDRASRYIELEVTALGAADLLDLGGLDRFEFKAPVTITIDYSRCARGDLEGATLTVWQIDPVTKRLLERMGGEDDKESRTITFETDHLSVYSIAR